MNQKGIELFKTTKIKAEKGDANAQCILGLLYSTGIGVEKNYEEAAKCFRKAAEQGYAEAQNSLGRMYWHGRGVPRDDLVALQWTQNAAEQGHAEARSFLERAHEFMVTEMKAEKGDAEAHFDFGLMCHNSEVAPQEYKDFGHEWIWDAAEGGCDDALSLMINTSEGDKISFLYWIEEGVKQRKGWVQFVRGEIYEEGEVVLKNFIEAYAWFLVAKANGTEHAEEKISDLEKRLTAEGIEEGQARAAELQRSFGAEEDG